MIELRNLVVHYGRVAAVHDISLSFDHGINCIIGSNGAGKSTIMRSISGLVRPSSGSILFEGEAIESLTPKAIVERGIAHVPEGRHVFPELTVDENLKIGAYLRRDQVAVKRDYDNICSVFPRLAERRKQYANTLSGGEQQMLAIGRAIMAAPKLVLMDEPSMGLSPVMVAAMAEVIRSINAEGKSVLLVEQNANVALGLSAKAAVLEQGRISLQGMATDMKDNEHVRVAYIGV
ncbi:ABC transporter ATP-binding protein [Rhizobium sp. NZLR1]|jgi:branched-chain amino acid transport system ATP-binding protein|uniref:ABC transporter ATP-binding protein n=1 Tax=Rhizobium sp. NZLR1 TaxID=2731096 RepID=UPI001A98E2FB|nr:ABC transporter ATP-binding protein [Rhizobium sp. NZLR1]MBX5204115.1 ABC transporter ATP-binding protein [Rhizobium sp. NZLR1]QSZ25094.1 ABC transporter ATP-binding protein [Rhizobium sp. NZLR1]